ncbi:PEP-CTERM sorting domain-containing protein [Botrimarina mediterranea]|uniref:PEP-CTERM motif protein n=1 Tax=Botrimarina mediterranea TaxID=2528022 RepID=A0A518K923_9BACT|nr:PEP-CTERM sorting domain-containing protein [Botrimarina mediterranea]QDV74298.1 PEP-CTERM motif protein [Botrimarina mediterranea]
MPDPQRDIHSTSGDFRRTSRYLAAYSVAAASGAILADEAAAAVIPINLPGGGPLVIGDADPGVNYQSVNLDIDGDGVDDFRFKSYVGVDITDDLHYLNGVILDYMAFSVRYLNAGDLIDDALTIDNGYQVLRLDGSFDNFTGTRGYAAVRFDIPGGSPHYGYLDVAVNDSGSQLTLFGGAYESVSGVGIRAGAVPEPAGLGLLAMGAAGVAAWRRRS